MSLPDQIECLTIFTPDVEASRRFYVDVLGRPVVFEDDVCVIVRFGDLMVNCLELTAAGELVTPLAASHPVNSPHCVLTVRVENVDTACAELGSRGVVFLNGPIDRPWGRRTAAFSDPSGHVWELAQEID